MSKERKPKSYKKLPKTELDCHESSIAVKNKSWQKLIKIPILLEKQTFTAVIDTGSSLSFINNKTFSNLKLNPKIESKTQVRLIDQSLVIIDKSVFLNVICQGHNLIHKFFIFNQMKNEVILGLDFLGKTGLEIKADKINPIILSLTEDKDIPKHSIVSLPFPPIHENNYSRFVPSEIMKKKYNLIIDETIIDNSKPFEIKIMNLTNQNKFLNRNIKIGRLDHIEYLEFDVEEDTEVCNFTETPFDLNKIQIKIKTPKLLNILVRYSHLFAEDISQLQRATNVKHYIDTGEHPPIRSMPYRTSYKEKEIIENEVKKMLDSGLIKESKSPWSSPIVLVPKKDGTIRFAIDYRKLNSITKKDAHSVPLISDILETLSESRIYTKLDLRSGFWAISLDEKTQEKTAFTTHLGLFEWLVLPFGLSNSPSCFQRYLQQVLNDYLWRFVLVFIDDICIFSKTTEEHEIHVQKVLERLDKHNLRLNPSKCEFSTDQITYLGHVITPEGLKPDPEKIMAVKEFPVPRRLKDVRSFLGLSSYYRRFIKGYAQLAKPMNILLEKDQPFIWSEECQKAFDTLKEKLITPPIISHFIPGLPIILYTDACGYAIGGILAQLKEGKEHVIAYISKSLTKEQMKYSVCELEALAILWSIQKLRHYLYGAKFTIKTDNHSLCYLMKMKDVSGRLARWSLILQGYDFDIAYKSGKLHTNCDCISRYPFEKPDPDIDDFAMLLIEDLNIAEKQQKDTWCKEIVRQLTENKNKKYLINYEIKNGLLYRVTQDDSQRKIYLLCVPKKLRRKILTELHDSPMSGHLGFLRTYTKLRERFFWRKIENSVRQYCRNCRSCQLMKGVRGLPYGDLNSIKYPRFAWEFIGMDIAGSLNVTPRKNRYIIVVIDYYTRYIEMAPLKNMKSQTIADFFVNNIVVRYGAVKTVLTDLGRSFKSDFIEDVFKLVNSKHVCSTAYHPQTNGLCERVIQTVRSMLSHYVNERFDDWDLLLNKLAFAYNSTKQSTTGESPYKLLFGREPLLPIDITFNLPNDFRYGLKYKETMEDCQEIVRIRVRDAQESQKAHYDSKHFSASFNVGDLVALHENTRVVGMSQKFFPKFSGPYKITRQITPVTYEIQSVEFPRKKKKKVNISRLKKWNSDKIDELDEPEPVETTKEPKEPSASDHSDHKLEDSKTPSITSLNEGSMEGSREPDKDEEFVTRYGF